MNKSIALLPGDGVGPEVMAEAVKVLEKIGQQFGHKFNFETGLLAGAAWEKYYNHLPEETIALCKKADAMLLGAVGGPVSAQNEPKWKDAEKNSILGLRKIFQLNVNLRPVLVNPLLADLSPLKKSIVEQGIDFIIVRELIGDVYFGEHKNEGDSAYDVMSYSKEQIEIAIRYAFEAAQLRRKKVTVVDKANVLETSRLWRRVAEEVKKDFPEITMEYMFVDNAAQQIIKNPSQFDVIATGNLFGDILSDAAAVLPGSLGLMPSASFGKEYALYEPIHGSAPDIAGQNVVNPIATILSAAMLLRFSFKLEKEAQVIEAAVNQTIQAGIRTKDIAEEHKPIGTQEMGEAIVARIEKNFCP
ncbi:MAG: 3-isopropylmalate dehydrogenase [bacterium]